jgi:hypothetical protein
MEKTLGVEDSIPKTIIKLSYKKRCILQQQCKRHTRIKTLVSGWEHSRLFKVKQSTEILEHAGELELSPTVIAFVFATSFSAMKCYKLRVETVCTMCTICARQRLHLEEGFLGEQ